METINSITIEGYPKDMLYSNWKKNMPKFQRNNAISIKENLEKFTYHQGEFKVTHEDVKDEILNGLIPKISSIRLR